MKLGITWKMKYKKLLALIAVFSLVLCGCNNDVDLHGPGDDGGNTDIPTGDDPDSTVTDDTGPGIQEPDTGGNTGDSNPDSYTRYQRYYYEPYKSDFSSSSNTLNKNGLTWSYTSAPIGDDSDTYARGIQIASGGGATGWTFSTNFGEDVCLEDFEVGLSVSSSGSFTASITFGDYDIGTVNTTSQSVTDFELDGNYYIGDSLTFKCTNGGSKSCYLKYIAFTVYTLPNSSLNLTSDVGEGDYDPTVKDRKYSASDVNTYYSSINDSMSGETLFNALFSISTIKTKYSYGDARYCLPYTDCGVVDTDHLYGLFDGAALVPGWDQARTWNREHVWPQSKLGESGNLGTSTTDARSDLHNLRASTISSNSAKGDKYVDNTNTSSTFYPNYGEGDHRGDVARICFYMYLMYRDSNGLELSDNPSSGSSTTYGILSTMLVWNEEDEPDEFEIQRNNRVEEYQGNRNPFIDHPEYASRIFS